MRLHRLLGIIMLLDSHGIMKAGNLAKILETSERTIVKLVFLSHLSKVLMEDILSWRIIELIQMY